MMPRKKRGMSFMRFVTEVLHVELTHAQRVFCLVAFDEVNPSQLNRIERAIAHKLFGEVDEISPTARNVIALRKGARVGGTYIFGALRLLHLALTVVLDTLAPGEVAAAVIVAPDLRLARQALRYVAGAAHDAADIKNCIEAETVDSLTLHRPDGRVVEIACLPATWGGRAGRGRSLVAVLLDEASFFRDMNYVVNDREVFRPLIARIVIGGQLVIMSTPWTEGDLLHELVEQNFGNPRTALAAIAPTLLMRDDEHTKEVVAREYERDQENADREFGARPLSGSVKNLFDALAITACTDESLPLVLEPLGTGTCGLDTAFRRDASACVIVRSVSPKAIIEVAECVEIKPPAGGRLVPTETLELLLRRARHHGCKRLAYDQHYADLVSEVAGDRFIRIEGPGGATGKADAYQLARTLIHEGRVRIPATQRRLLAQLREVVAKPTPGGGLAISSPRRAGSHGDLVSALVLALWAERGDGVANFDFEAANRTMENVMGMSNLLDIARSRQ